MQTRESLSRLSAPRAAVFLTALPSLPALHAHSHPFIFTHSPFPCALSCLPAIRVFLTAFYFTTRRYVYTREKPYIVYVRNPLISYIRQIYAECRIASHVLNRISRIFSSMNFFFLIYRFFFSIENINKYNYWLHSFSI